MLGDWTERRRSLAGLYTSGLAGVGLVLPTEEPYARAVDHLFVVRHRARDALARGLERRGIGTLVHYPIPLHLQPALRAWRHAVALRAAHQAAQYAPAAKSGNGIQFALSSGRVPSAAFPTSPLILAPFGAVYLGLTMAAGVREARAIGGRLFGRSFAGDR